MTIFCYSTDQENYHEAESKDREGAALEAMYELLNDVELGEVRTVWVGEKVEAMEILRKLAARFAETVIESLDEWLIDEISSDEPIIDMPKEMHQGLGKLFLDYVAEHASFSRWGVDNITEHQVIVSEAA
jgi:hypothetical protein